MSRLTTALNNDFTALCFLRDELALQINLLEAEAKDRWAALEAKMDKLREHAGRAEVAAGQSAKEVDALTDKPGPGAKTAFPVDHENYYVEYAQRSDKGNEPEVHTHWTHYIQVLSGEASLTYGGTVTNAPETSPGQIRGERFECGRELAQVSAELGKPAGRRCSRTRLCRESR